MNGAVGNALFGDLGHRVLTAYPFGGHWQWTFIGRGSIGVMMKIVEIYLLNNIENFIDQNFDICPGLEYKAASLYPMESGLTDFPLKLLIDLCYSHGECSWTS